MTLLTLLLRGLRFYRRTHLGVFGGVTLAVAVLVGSLLVGDSVQYTLERFAAMRLGAADVAIGTDGRFFSGELTTRLADELGAPTAGLLSLPCVARRATANGRGEAQVNRARVLGVDRRFWRLGPGPAPALPAGAVILSTRLATALDARPGDELYLRIEKPGLLPRDAPLAARTEEPSTLRAVRVASVTTDENMGRFSLAANQVAPYNAFVDLAWLQEQTGLPGRENLLVAGAAEGGVLSPEVAEAALRRTWRPEHVGVAVREHAALGVIQVTSDRVFLDPGMSGVLLAQRGSVGALGYLVNGIARADGEGGAIPYSFAMGVSPSADAVLSPVPEDMGDDEIVLIDWVADRLKVAAGDRVTMRYYELTALNRFEEKTRAFSVRKIVPVASVHAERALFPDFPGLTDADDCRKWDIGMPLQEDQLRDADNVAYWEQHRQTPKAFVTLAAAREMWANRFGDLSSVRWPVAAGRDAVARTVAASVEPASVGLFVLPVREQAASATAQAENLASYIVSMSFFLIVSALMLTGLLFVFGVEQRAEEIGNLLAVGYRRRTVRRLFLGEGAAIAAIGSVAGACLGMLYTRLTIMGLATYWKGAVANSAIQYHAEPATLALGGGVGFLCAIGAITLALRGLTRRTVGELLSRDPGGVAGTGRRGRLGLLVGGIALVAAVGLVVRAVAGGADRAVGTFFGAGSLLLVGGIVLCRSVLVRMGSVPPGPGSDRFSPARLGVRNMARRPGRSVAVITLLACGSFMVFAVAAMYQDLTIGAGQRSSGTGGFELFVESTLPVVGDLNEDEPRRRYRLDREAALAGAEYVPIKVRRGDDASCFNLNRAQAPRLLGVDPGEFARRGAFTPTPDDDLWSLLDAQPADGAIPALVGDGDTAAWALKAKAHPEKGTVLSYRDERGEAFNVKLVGALPMRLSVFQGTLLISSDAFAQRYPSEAGYRMMLVDVPDEQGAAAERALEKRLDRVGADVTPSGRRLADFFSVQTAYLGMFLVLGGLGLLLGSVGLAIVVLRNVLECRSELALLRAVGFTRATVRNVVLSGHCSLLIMGLFWGVVSSAAAIYPSLCSPGANVPYVLIAVLIGAMAVSGLLWVLLAAVAALRRPLLPSLRNE